MSPGDAAALDGARVLVTGASRGYGAAIARALAMEGAHLLITATDGTRLTPVADECRALGAAALLAGFEGKRTASTVEEIRYAATGATTVPPVTGGVEQNNALFARLRLEAARNLSVVLGGRGDFWRSTPEISTLPTHTARFFSPRAAAEWKASDLAVVEVSAARAAQLGESFPGVAVSEHIPPCESAVIAVKVPPSPASSRPCRTRGCPPHIGGKNLSPRNCCMAAAGRPWRRC